MLTSSWTHFTVRITIKAPEDQLYESWISQNGLEKWFLKSAIFKKADGTLREPAETVQKGDTYEWRWFGHPNHVQYGKVLDNNGVGVLKFTFDAESIVTFRMTREQGENIMEIHQENIPPEDDPKKNLYIGCQLGWTFFLANIKSILEGGVDLRSKNDHIKSLVNA